MAKADNKRLKALLAEDPTPLKAMAGGGPAEHAHGEKGDFVKVTVTLPPAVYQVIMTEVTRRKMVKERDPNMSAIIREAVMSKLGTGS